jgi:PhoH-like ATPase
MAKAFIIDETPSASDSKMLLHFADNVVVILPHIIDRLEARPSGRETLDILAELGTKGSLRKGVATPDGGVVIVDDHAYTPPNSSLRPTTSDYMIVCTAARWQNLIRQKQIKKQKAQGKSEPDAAEAIIHRFSVTEVRIVSKRSSLRAKASAYGILADDYRHNKVVRSASEIYSGVITIPVSQGSFQEFARLLCQSGPAGISRDALDGLIATPSLFPNECCIFTCGEKTVLAIHKVDPDGTSRFVNVQKPQPPQPGNGLQPRNFGQAFELALLRDPSITCVTLSGAAGSGKTLLPCSVGLELCTADKYSQLLVYRPGVELGQKMGYLPGTLDEKMDPWKQPINDALKLIQKISALADKKKSGYNIPNLFKSGKISIEPINYLQGRTLQDEYVLVDEAENLTPEEAKAAITRAGEGAKFVLAGDVTQVATDSLDAGNNGLTHVIEGMCGDEAFGHITLEESVRSRLAKVAGERL